jgi:hypothetical protein
LDKKRNEGLIMSTSNEFLEVRKNIRKAYASKSL